jgi:hypothetical protein
VYTSCVIRGTSHFLIKLSYLSKTNYKKLGLFAGSPLKVSQQRRQIVGVDAIPIAPETKIAAANNAQLLAATLTVATNSLASAKSPLKIIK